MKRNPDDPEDEFERRNYRLNNMVDDVFCARESFYSLEQAEADEAAVREMFSKSKSITDLVHEVINQREKIGMAIYHRPLTAFDGRDTLQDAIEEAADLLQYLVKLKVERDDAAGRVG